MLLTPLVTAAVSLPLASLLGAALAFRARRRGAPRRESAVAHTQILLAVIGALVMLVIGESIARAFGIVGVAGLVRYRVKISDPKEATVMLCALGVGFASGIQAYALAVFSTLFILALLWIIEARGTSTDAALTGDDADFAAGKRKAHLGRAREDQVAQA